MNKRIKIALLLFVLIIVGFFSVRYYVYHYSGRDVKTEKAAFTVASGAITAEFTSNADAANKKYLDKPVAIRGKVSSVNAKEVILDNSVNCGFSQADTSIKVGQSLTVKGRVIGFDDLLGELKLDQCSLSDKQ